MLGIKTLGPGDSVDNGSNIFELSLYDCELLNFIAHCD